jgi:hypothetical protein
LEEKKEERKKEKGIKEKKKQSVRKGIENGGKEVTGSNRRQEGTGRN